MKKTIFLTGATGLMGWAGLQELLKHTDRYNLVVLARHSKHDSLHHRREGDQRGGEEDD